MVAPSNVLSPAPIVYLKCNVSFVLVVVLLPLVPKLVSNVAVPPEFNANWGLPVTFTNSLNLIFISISSPALYEPLTLLEVTFSITVNISSRSKSTTLVDVVVLPAISVIIALNFAVVWLFTRVVNWVSDIVHVKLVSTLEILYVVPPPLPPILL